MLQHYRLIGSFCPWRPCRGWQPWRRLPWGGGGFVPLFFVVFLTLVMRADMAIADDARMQQAAPWEHWQARLHRTHPMVGRIWSRKAGGFVSRAALLEALRQPGFTLLGEVHDNLDHHRLQAWLIAQMVRQGRRPAIVWEQIARDQQGQLAAYLARPDADARGLGKALQWQKSGWPRWSLYQPIAKVALRQGLAMFAGDVAKTRLRQVGRRGLAALSAERRRALGLDVALAPRLRSALVDELVASHCHLLPREAMAPLVAVQRLRDAILADSLLQAATKAGRSTSAGDVVLITGNGHVRTDRAVPWYLRHRRPGARVVSVMLLEVWPELQSLADLSSVAGVAGDGLPAADFVWFTPAEARADQCAQLKKYFRRKKKKPAKRQGAAPKGKPAEKAAAGKDPS